jgi:UDP-GlcNAc:undecaprenyl-phosphate GlcNAc-1-phosphate transferase
LAAGVSAIVVLALTPLAIRLALATAFLDRPVGYKAHGRPTPYMGGAAVVAGLVVGHVVGGAVSEFAAITLCAVGLWALGTADDRMTVRPAVRVAAEIAAGAMLWALDWGWSVFGWEPLNLVLSCAWIVAIVNSFNLMDNIDGAAAGVAFTCAAAVAALALVDDQTALAATALGLAGSCAAFLRFNLTAPARIFLGDGGSMPIGFVVGATAMAAAKPLGSTGLLVGGLVVGLPIFDTALVIVSRRRRSLRIVTAGLDHLTHRLLRELRSPRRVTVALALGQLVLGACAVAASQAGEATTVALAAMCLVGGAGAIALLETARWHPDSPQPRHHGIATVRGGSPARVTVTPSPRRSDTA